MADPTSPIAPPPTPSPWWWFLPPVMLVLRRRRSIAHHRTILSVLTPQQRAHRDRFVRKTTGRFAVAVGRSFIAVKETWELAEHNEWHPAVFVLVLVVMFALVGGNTVWQASRWSRRTGPVDAAQRSH